MKYKKFYQCEEQHHKAIDAILDWVMEDYKKRFPINQDSNDDSNGHQEYRYVVTQIGFVRRGCVVQDHHGDCPKMPPFIAKDIQEKNGLVPVSFLIPFVNAGAFESQICPKPPMGSSTHFQTDLNIMEDLDIRPPNGAVFGGHTTTHVSHGLATAFLPPFNTL